MLAVGFRAPLAKGFEIVAGRWALWVAAAVFGGAVSALCYDAFRDTPATYPDFIVGYLSIRGVGKAPDYAMLLGFSLGAAGFFVLLAGLFGQLFERAGAAAVEDAYRRLIIAVIPALAWLGTFLLPSGSQNLELFWASVFLVVALTVGLGLVIAKAKVWEADSLAHRTGAILDGVMLAPVAAILAAFAVGMVGNRLGILYGERWFKEPAALHEAALGAAALAVVAIFAIVLRAPGPEKAAAGLRKLLLLFQLFLPALFLALLPLPTVHDGRIDYVDVIVPATWALLVLLTGLAWVEIVRWWRRRDADPANSFSIFSLIAVLIFCRVSNQFRLGSVEDDYHAGEFIVPWWAWIKHGLVPYWDLAPARGLVNYKFGLFAAIFADNDTAASLLTTAPQQFLALVLLVFFPLALVIGKWPAFLFLSFAALDDVLGDIDVMMTAALCVLAYAWTRCSHIRWLTIWLAVGICAVLVAAGQGGMLVIATMPAGAWRIYQAVRYERAALLRTGAIVLVVIIALGLATPIGRMVLGAVRYGAEQSAVNGIANGIPWILTFGSVPYIHPWMLEVLRFGWVGVGAIAIVATIWALISPQHPRRDLVLFLGSTISILCCIWVTRAAGRIDPGSVGRSGWMTIWALALLLPLLLSTLLQGTRRYTALALTTAAAATLTGQFWTVGFGPAIQRPFMTQGINPALIDGDKIGVPRLGSAHILPDHADRLVAVKAHLDRLLEPDETYLDMTNRGGHYFLLDRPPPGESIAYYNMITSGQQRRAVEAVEKQRVPVALTWAHNVMPEGLKASARAPLVYRHLLLHFVPVDFDGIHFMVRPDRLARAGVSSAGPDNLSEEELRLLEHDFHMSDFGRTSASWGKSAAALKKQVRNVVELRDPSSLQDLERIDEKTYRVTGAKPVLSFDLEQANIRGRDAGLLWFDFKCTSKAEPLIWIEWTEADAVFNQRASVPVPAVRRASIVPLDTAPRWLLSKKLGSLRLILAEPAHCQSFTLEPVVLAQRREADAIDAVVRRSDSP